MGGSRRQGKSFRVIDLDETVMMDVLDLGRGWIVESAVLGIHLMAGQ
jgi:hypothetical protein